MGCAGPSGDNRAAGRPNPVAVLALELKHTHFQMHRPAPQRKVKKICPANASGAKYCRHDRSPGKDRRSPSESHSAVRCRRSHLRRSVTPHTPANSMPPSMWPTNPFAVAAALDQAAFGVEGSRVILNPQNRMTRVLAMADATEPRWDEQERFYDILILTACTGRIHCRR